MGSNDGAAQNYGGDGHLPYDERYVLADELADVATRPWEAWGPDTVVLDRKAPMLADGSKVHPDPSRGQVLQGSRVD